MRQRKRNLISWYYDRMKKQIRQASACDLYPCLRPNRYVFLGQFTRGKTEKALRLILFKKTHIQMANPKPIDLPF